MDLTRRQFLTSSALATGALSLGYGRAAASAFGSERTVVVRPTYIVGPGDRSNRFEYWPARIQRGGEILVPGNWDDPTQYIDVRDLTGFMIRLPENEASGTFNCVGPESHLGMHAFVHGVHAVTSAAVEWVPIPDYDFLIEHDVPYAVPWIMPAGNEVGSARINFQRALGAGLTYRPLGTTAADTREWWYSHAVTPDRRSRMETHESGLMAGEAGIIAAWRAR